MNPGGDPHSLEELRDALTGAVAEYERLRGASDRPLADEVARLIARIDGLIDTWAGLCGDLAEPARDERSARAHAAARKALPRLAWLRSEVLPLDLHARRPEH